MKKVYVTQKEFSEKLLEVYQRCCAGCIHECECHIDCTTCDAYDVAVQEVEDNFEVVNK